MRRLILGIVTVLFISLGMNPFPAKAAIADGTYTINYQVNKPGSSSASMANDYFAKPAKLIVNNGKMTMQLTIKNSSWVTEFNPPGGAKVISSNEAADQRVVQFSVASASLVTIAMKIDIQDIDYHHSYSVDFVFNEASLTLIEAAKAPEPTTSSNSGTGQGGSGTQGNSTSNNGNTTSQKPATGQNVGTSNQENNSASNNGTSQNSEDEVVTDSDSEKDDNTDLEISEDPEKNPETADPLPIVYMLLFAGALVLFFRNKKIKI